MNKNIFAPFPPMGWNSYDYYDTTVDEAAIRANAEYMAQHLKSYGWEYIVVDIQWYAYKAGSMRNQFQYIPFGSLEMDEFSRLLPDPERFPSSVNGAGFRPLADYVHSLGLKFGIHIMRGIPRIAAHMHGKIKNCKLTADMVANPSSVCEWNPDMYGVKNSLAGQAYYDSLLELYASWGVDFIKCDDICNTNNHSVFGEGAYSGRHEIEMLANAIQKCGRPIVFSLSPGPALIEQAWHYAKYANMWRITDDMWDDWNHVKNMFYRCELWQNHVSCGCYPDCDMLPLGKIGKGFGGERTTRLNHEEQRTLMTLWCIFGSPLMLGAEMTKLDEWTLSLLTNKKVLEMLNPSFRARQICRDSKKAVWVKENSLDGSCYVALFNLADVEQEVCLEPDSLVNIFSDSFDTACSDTFYDKLGYEGRCQNSFQCHAINLWTGEIAEFEDGVIDAEIAAHGCRLYQIYTIGNTN